MPKPTIIHGEASVELARLPSDSVDAVITDPPYASGGYGSAKNALPSTKYQQTGTIKKYPDFVGDQVDQRAWTAWCERWLRECLRVTRPGGYLLTFIDWRQLPALTDAVQYSGWIWRGIIAWDKTDSARAPHKGYFRHQCEYIVWATKGTCPKATHDGPFPGAYRVRVDPREKLHMTGKPLALMRELCRCVPPGATILDPFAGSGTTLVAARDTKRHAIGIEMTEAYHRIAKDRLNAKASN